MDFESRGGYLIARCQGELDLAAASRLREAVDRALQGRQSLRLCLDLAGVTFIDSSGVGAILGRYRWIAQRGGHMVIVGARPQVRAVLELSGVLSVIPLLNRLPSDDSPPRHGSG